MRAAHEFPRDSRAPQAYVNAGQQWQLAGKLDAAIADYDAALKARPREAWSLYGRAIAEKRVGKTDAADADRKAALAINPDVGKQRARLEDLLATLPPSYLEATSVPDMVDDLRLVGYDEPMGLGDLSEDTPGVLPNQPGAAAAWIAFSELCEVMTHAHCCSRSSATPTGR